MSDPTTDDWVHTIFGVHPASYGTTTGASSAPGAKPALSANSNGEGTFVLSGSGFVGDTAYIRASRQSSEQARGGFRRGVK